MRFLFQFLLQVFFQDHSIVVLGVVRTINKRDIAPLRFIENRAQRVWIRIQFSAVASLEFPPFLRIMIELPAQGRARCNVFQPRINAQGGFLHAAGPQPLDQITGSVG
jgi:hypothetical protein